MILFNVNDTKKMMNHILKGEVFDNFEARGVTLSTFTLFDINCVYDKSYAETDESDVAEMRYCFWRELRPTVFELIKGKKTPRFFKVIFALKGERAEEINQNAAALYMTIKYENGAISVLTGCSQSKFSLDKNVDNDWDSYCRQFFANNEIEISFDY